MNSILPPYKKLVLICSNVRADGTACCAGPLTGSGSAGSEEFRAALKAKCKERKLPVRVSKSGCLGMCATGPTVVIMPDNLWFGGAGMGDIDAIITLLEKSLADAR